MVLSLGIVVLSLGVVALPLGIVVLSLGVVALSLGIVVLSLGIVVLSLGIVVLSLGIVVLSLGIVVLSLGIVVLSLGIVVLSLGIAELSAQSIAAVSPWGGGYFTKVLFSLIAVLSPELVRARLLGGHCMYFLLEGIAVLSPRGTAVLFFQLKGDCSAFSSPPSSICFRQCLVHLLKTRPRL